MTMSTCDSDDDIISIIIMIITYCWLSVTSGVITNPMSKADKFTSVSYACMYKVLTRASLIAILYV